MTNVNAPSGLRPLRYDDGSPYNGAFNVYSVAASYATALYVGDPVVKVAGGSNAAALDGFPIGTLPLVERATAGDAGLITGVIVGFAPDPNNLDRIYNPASTARVVYVADDPSLVFEVQATAAVPAADMGLNANVTYTVAGSNATGRSGVQLDMASTGTGATKQLNIRRAVNKTNNDTTLTVPKVEVVINHHTQVPRVAGI
jgi:hypothetical protein